MSLYYFTLDHLFHQLPQIKCRDAGFGLALVTKLKFESLKSIVVAGNSKGLVIMSLFVWFFFKKDKSEINNSL